MSKINIYDVLNKKVTWKTGKKTHSGIVTRIGIGCVYVKKKDGEWEHEVPIIDILTVKENE